MAILNGNYAEVAGDGEELPDYVVRLLPFLRYKTTSKGARAGERVSPELFASLNAPASKEELDRFRPRLNCSKRPGSSGITKRALFFVKVKY